MTALLSGFAQRLEPVGRILELPDWHVWGSSPIDGPDGKVHLFSARWPVETGFGGWSTHSQIVHSVASEPEGPFEVVDVVLTGRGGRHWDAAMVHNPTIHEHEGRYYLFHIGNLDGRPFTQQIGVAVSDSLYGPWTRLDDPVLGPSQYRAWDWLMATNPALLRHSNGQFWLYYKSWDMADLKRKMGLAVADHILGPYHKHPDNPIVDYSPQGKQVEDAYVWFEDGLFYMLMADDNEGVVCQHGGALITSEDGIHWSEPQIGYQTTEVYFEGEPVRRFERPQVLLRDGHPAYLYLAMQGDEAASPALLRVRR
ncbi:MAG TPA: glycosyl hydrolase family 43 [Armatimonadetes bacterium]|nr:glycosyl hydrolase family 43 [Armatimonadota bacterium]